MSDLKDTNPQNEEVDLGQLFNAIGKLFEKLFNFIASLFRGIFKVIIYSLKPLVNNFKLISVVVLLFAIVGFVAEKFKAPIYESDMLVRPYFDSKYQLANNVNYFNALIGEQNLSELSIIFEIDTLRAKELLSFEMKIGPETPNDLLKEYDTYLKSIDSTLAVQVSYEEFIENRDILAANVFSIVAKAKKNDVFVSLEKGFRKTFENEYSKRIRTKRDDTIKLRRESYEKQLEEVRRLQEVYVKVIESDSENPEVSIGPEGMFPLQQTKRETKEFDLLQKELQLRTEISKLDEILVKDDVYFDILAGFEEVGSRANSITMRYSIILPAIAFGIIILSFVLIKVFNFIKNYDN